MKLFHHRTVLLGSFLGLALIPAIFIACTDSASVRANSGGGQKSGDAQSVSLEIVHETCDLESSNTDKQDANGDKKPDITTVMSGGKKVCRAVDLNFDGKIDRYTYFDDEGKLRRTESDYDRDGLIDEIALYKSGVLVARNRETNLDGKLDTWDTYENGKLVKRMRDGNADGRVEQWWTFPDPDNLDCPVVAYDTDGDGRPDDKVDVCKEREKEAKEQGFVESQNATTPDAGHTTSSDASPNNDNQQPGDEKSSSDAGNSSNEDGGTQ